LRRPCLQREPAGPV